MREQLLSDGMARPKENDTLQASWSFRGPLILETVVVSATIRASVPRFGSLRFADAANPRPAAVEGLKN